ncbi:hypothetical protein D3C80_2131070 [compost metagenome]
MYGSNTIHEELVTIHILHMGNPLRERSDLCVFTRNYELALRIDITVSLRGRVLDYSPLLAKIRYSLHAGR